MEVCTMRERLLLQWKDATALYDELSTALMQHIGVIEKGDYDHLHNTTQQVGRIAEKLRCDLVELHVNIHRCG